MWIPFCPKMTRQSRPANDAENVKLMAPMFDATASAMEAARLVSYGRAAARMTLVRRMVVPMLVPKRLHRITVKMPINQMVGCSR